MSVQGTIKKGEKAFIEKKNCTFCFIDQSVKEQINFTEEKQDKKQFILVKSSGKYTHLAKRKNDKMVKKRLWC